LVDAYEPTEPDLSHPLVCLACGIPLEEPLSFLGPLRCNDCLSVNKALDKSLLAFADGAPIP
jgi:hypothetical protein